MNAFANPNLIATRALRRLENNLVMGGLINREYDDQFNTNGVKPGVTINIRKPARYLGREGARLQKEGMSAPTVPLTIDTQFGVDMGYSSQQEALNLDSYDEQVIEPAVSRIAQYIDSKIMEKAYRDVYNHTGTPGTVPASLDVFIDAGVILNDNAVPETQRRAVINPRTEGSVVKAERLRFNPNKEASEMFRTGSMGNAAGFDFYQSQSVKSHTIGAYVGTPRVNGAGQIGTSLITDGWTGTVTGLLKRGDIFTLAGVNRMNPGSYEDTGQVQQFVITADVDSAAGAATISFQPEIIVSGPYQTVSAVPADDALLTVFGALSTATAQNLVFHKDFATLAMVDLYVPKGVDMAGKAASKKRNLSIRFIRFYDGIEDELITRLDVLFGVKVLRPEMAARVSA